MANKTAECPYEHSAYYGSIFFYFDVDIFAEMEYNDHDTDIVLL